MKKVSQHHPGGGLAFSLAACGGTDSSSASQAASQAADSVASRQRTARP